MINEISKKVKDNTQASKINSKVLLGFSILAFIHLTIIVFILAYWPADADEGGYLIVSQKVINGMLPVLDINAHSQPLVYYFYGFWMKLFGFNIFAGRSLSLIAIFVTGILLFFISSKLTKHIAVSFLIYTSFILSVSYFKLAITVRPFALFNMFLLAAFSILAFSNTKNRESIYRSLFISGFLLGLTIGVRQIFLLPIAFILWISFISWQNHKSLKSVVRSDVVFCSGMIIPLIPTVFILFSEPERAMALWGGIYNQIYWGIGNNPDFYTDVYGITKIPIAIENFLRVIKLPDVLPFIGTAVISIYMLGKRIYKTENLPAYTLSLMILISIVLVNSTLFLAYVAYVNQAMIYLLILSLPLISSIYEKVHHNKKVLIALPLILVTIFGIGISYSSSITNKLILFTQSQTTNPIRLNKIAEIIKTNSKPGDMIFDTWGLFAFAAQREVVPGYEYPTGVLSNFLKDQADAIKYKYLAFDDLYQKIKNKEFKMIILTENLTPAATSNIKQLKDQDRIMRIIASRYYKVFYKFLDSKSGDWIVFYTPQ